MVNKPSLVQRWVLLPDYVVERLEAAAMEAGRSFSAHVREVLGASVKPEAVDVEV